MSKRERKRVRERERERRERTREMRERVSLQALTNFSSSIVILLRINTKLHQNILKTKIFLVL